MTTGAEVTLPAGGSSLPAGSGRSLQDGDVHVWHVELDRPEWPVGQLTAYLSPDERHRADRLRFEGDRRRFATSRAILRHLLASYLGTEPAALEFQQGSRGKPEVSMPSATGPPVRFNGSRSQGHALFAVTLARRVGVDVEVVRPVPEAEAIARRWFSPRERAVLAGVPAGRRDEAFLRTWTGKEAHVKALGRGISDGLGHVDPAALPQGPAPVDRSHGDGGRSPCWCLRWFTPPGLVGAVAAEGADLRLEWRALEPPTGGAATTHEPTGAVETWRTSRS